MNQRTWRDVDMSRATGRVTLQDIAQATGYTSNTISRALKDKPDIAPETRKLIQQKAREMGYVRNYIASSLRSGRTKTIALISGTMSNPFYAVLADLIQREAFRLGYSLMILCSLDDPETEISTVEMALSRQVDGILMIPWSSHSPALETLRRSGVPFVLLNRFVGDEHDDYIICDEEQGGYLVGRHLIEAGHKKLAMITHMDVTYSTRTRFRGFRRACEEAGIAGPDIAYAQVSRKEDILRQLLQWKREGFTGIFSFCDVEAWEEIDLLEKAGLRVPEDMAVVGFDNIAGYINYPRSLCSVDCNYKEEAVLAVDFLRNRIHNPAMPPQKKTMPVSLVCLHSCRR